MSRMVSSLPPERPSTDSLSGTSGCIEPVYEWVPILARMWVIQLDMFHGMCNLKHGHSSISSKSNSPSSPILAHFSNPHQFSSLLPDLQKKTVRRRGFFGNGTPGAYVFLLPSALRSAHLRHPRTPVELGRHGISVSTRGSVKASHHALRQNIPALGEQFHMRERLWVRRGRGHCAGLRSIRNAQDGSLVLAWWSNKALCQQSLGLHGHVTLGSKECCRKRLRSQMRIRRLSPRRGD